MSRIFPTRSGAANAARKELGEGKFFRTTQNEDGDWKWHYEPGDCLASPFASLEFVAWVETAWNRFDNAPPEKLGVVVITCRIEELPDDFCMAAVVVEPITPELWEDPNAPQPKPRRASTGGERARSDVENPTKLVWQLADEMKGATRAEVVAACVERGVHKSTASTQYYRWKQARGS
jgi:hypothetical protein